MVFQLPNPYPARVYAFLVSLCLYPYSNSWSAIVPDPPFALNLTTYPFALHCAYKVTTSPATVEICEPSAPSAYASPLPSRDVFHPVNARFAYSYAFSARRFETPYSNSWSAIAPPPGSSPPFPSNTTVNVFAFHTAYSRTTAPSSVERSLTVCRST